MLKSYFMDPRARRAVDRANWPIRSFRLGEEPTDNLAAMTTPVQRLAMMWPLACQAWSLSRQEIPAYARAETPGLVIRDRTKRTV